MGTLVKSKRFKLNTSLFYTIAILLLGVNYLLYRFWEIESLKNVMRGGAALFLLLCIIVDKKKIKLTEVVLLIFAAYLIVINGDVSANIGFLLLCAIAPVRNDNAVYKQINKIQLCLTAVVLMMLATGLKSGVSYSFGSRRLRFTLGFDNVNAAAGFFFSVLVIWLYTRKSMNWWQAALAIGLVAALFIVTDSRTPFFASVCYFGVYWFTRYVKKKWFRRCYYWAAAVVMLVSFLNRFLLSAFPSLDALLSLRLSLTADYMASNSLFNLVLGGGKAVAVDNAYVDLLYNAGILFYAFFVYAVLAASKFYLYSGSRKELSFIMSVLVFGLMESSFLRAELLFSVVFWILIIRPVVSRKQAVKKPAALTAVSCR